MDGRERGRDGGGWTRAGLVRTAIGAGAVAAGGAAISGSRGDDAASLAAAQDADADILNFFLLLEYVQEGFYRESAEKAQLDGELLTYAQTVLGQEGEHIAFLEKWLGARARARPELDFGDATGSAERFRDTAIYLEEAAIAGYIGQGANLTRKTITDVATLISAEARQVAWVRDLAGINPAPHAADPARKGDDVVADLRKRGFLS
ncbi:MAG TPA: ferritin-like domain-containing protein [Solirubrobacteraceae bacterium]|nr:ferritin-like domain-containing protein [Solirubrobacteraceae bacterium]